MRATLRLFACAAAVAMLVPAAFAGHTHAPTPSTWTLNVGQSDFGGGPALKSDVYQIFTDTDTWLKFTDTTVDGDGKTWKGTWSGKPDGAVKPFPGMTGMKAGFNAADDSSHFELPDGTVQDCVLSMSSDKKKVTDKCTIKTKDGHSFNQTLVYDRTK